VQIAQHFRTILSKFAFSLQIFIKFLSIKFHGNPSSESSADKHRKEDGQTDGHDECKRRFSRPCNVPKHYLEECLAKNNM
jgi:hypothetical protein